jgi:hypothetical protein
MTQESLDRARSAFVDGYSRPANYATLCERVNALGTALADLKTQLAIYQQDKQVKGLHFPFPRPNICSSFFMLGAVQNDY